MKVQVLITTVTDGGKHSSTTIAEFDTIEQADMAAIRINNAPYMSWAKNYAVVL